MCWDIDLVTYGIYSDRASDEYLGKKDLLELVENRYDEVSGWKFGASLARIPTVALDYLYEATMTYSFGFSRSSIFCCAAALDLELKRMLIENLPHLEKSIEGQTFGQSVGLMKGYCSEKSQHELVVRLEWINRVRNIASAHPSKIEPLVSSYSDETRPYSSQDELCGLFSEEQAAAIRKEFQGKKIDWLGQLAYNVLWEAKKLIAEGPFRLHIP